jgi:hypothetical protein
LIFIRNVSAKPLISKLKMFGKFSSLAFLAVSVSIMALRFPSAYAYPVWIAFILGVNQTKDGCNEIKKGVKQNAGVRSSFLTD